jgi:hypothetical protein
MGDMSVPSSTQPATSTPASSPAADADHYHSDGGVKEGQATQTQQTQTTTTTTPKDTPQVQQDNKPQGPDPSTQANAASLANFQLQKSPEKLPGLSLEFMNVFDAIFREGYADYKPPPLDQGAGVHSDNQGRELQKDLQVIREFMRQANYLVKEEGMEVAQMFNWIKAEQGGAFWQKLQQVLQKGMPVAEDASFQKLTKGGDEVRDKAAFGLEKGLGGELGSKAVELTQQNPGKAMLELLKAEANPKLENMIFALQILKRDGMEMSAGKLLSYLRKRYNMSDEDMKQLLRKYQVAYFQGPMPREEKVLGPRSQWWWVLLALGAVPLCMLLGFSLVEATMVGILAMVVLLLLIFQFTK